MGPRLAPWMLRVVWIAVAWLGATAIDEATIDRSGTHTVALAGAGALWLVGVVAMAVPAVATLTVLRAVVPMTVPSAVVAWATGDVPTGRAVAFLLVAVLATVLAFGADIGRAYVQASAYGSEDRHLLRVPVGYGLACVLSWLLVAAAAIAGPLLLAAGWWIGGGVVTAVGVTLIAWSWPRWHRLSRRWVVVVPAGVVLHDHLVLAETVLLRRQELATLRLAPAGSDAADLTGPASGHAVEVLTHEPVTAIFAGTPRAPRGRAIHMTGCLVSPTRPGRVLAAALEQRLPVG